MQNTTERRQLILEYISDMREVKIAEIMQEFGISDKTARRDIRILSWSHPRITTTGRYGCGGRAMDGWYASRRYLHSEQEELLRSLMEGLQPEQQKVMQGILTAFAKPKVKEDKH